MPASVRWTVSTLGAAAVTGGLFVAMPSMIRIGDPEPGRALIAWQAANPPEYGGAFDPAQLRPLCLCSPPAAGNDTDVFDHSLEHVHAFIDFQLAYHRAVIFRVRQSNPGQDPD